MPPNKLGMSEFSGTTHAYGANVNPSIEAGLRARVLLGSTNFLVFFLFRLVVSIGSYGISRGATMRE